MRIAFVLITSFVVVFAAASADAAVLHHWKLDETSGGTAVDSEGANNGTWQDGTDNNLTWEAGQIGNAARIADVGGQIQHFDVGTLASLAGATQLSVSLWFKSDGENDFNGLFTSRNESNSGSWSVAWQGSNDVLDFHTSGSPNQLDSAGGLTADSNTWHHVLAVWNNDTGDRAVYINGDPAGTNFSTSDTFTGGSAFAGDGTWIIGSDLCCANDRDFDGAIDDVAVFDNALTATDAATIYNAGLAGVDVVTALVPEPSGICLSALCLAGLCVGRRRRK